ncbi:hypothetical protein CLAFUW4_00098 [Fulvia fulva]|uniref:Uncharacterized protein n=1 Tax=Passalora fulva TaxID=5499 RepID=A0A9Q8P441_PASFU|nr:uncharacterized protein CLAFUR5_00096 [Fulvia fulva]KAK4636275.1 hypothetical protein CLAFUR4_00098 [Fulvia fulva]KAK4637248.1 hypothetical protein CLAFUR0_00097 [Fulvia fulva]UJO12464.1 hypothetical protein CLAFUR5_00096 [Fulvia fulva]WPV08747.1 hypothetical protein CLAFUW4_00098 [Fulvia fulva]WPV24441.1 hypothetical protein CLAFUW7_00098 [Fulvia fulva]
MGGLYQVPAKRNGGASGALQSSTAGKPKLKVFADADDEQSNRPVKEEVPLREPMRPLVGRENENLEGFERPNTKKNRAAIKAEEEAREAARVAEATKSNIAVDWNATKAARTLAAKAKKYIKDLSNGGKTNATGPGRQQGRGGRSHKVIGQNGVKTVPDVDIDPKTVKYGVKLTDQKVGDFVWRDDLKPHVPFKGQEDWRIVKIDGREFYNKGRFWVIVAAHRDKVAECPVYTYKSKGLAEKDPKYCNPEEYLNLRPQHCENYQKQVKSMPVLQVMSQTLEPKPIDSPVMIVHFCEVQTRELNRYELQKSGRMTADSIAILKKYVHRGQDMIYGPAEEDVEEQD